MNNKDTRMGGMLSSPQEIWLYVIPPFLILLGIGFLFRGIRLKT